MNDMSNAQLELAAQMGEFYDDPLGHVMFSYPWGEKGTPLEHHSGPEPWQRDFLIEIGDEVRKRGFDGHTAVDPIRFSTASGHGIGKTTMVAWIIRWIMDTRPFARGIITAVTTPQLQSRTWSELAKWNNMAVSKHLWVLTYGVGSLSYFHKDFRENWRVDGQTAAKENAEAFQGMHNRNSTTFYIFDEASGIPEEIYRARDGGLTDGEPMVFDFGNPTQNTGRFFENMMGRFSDQYICRFIDSRTVGIANKKYLQSIIDKYGADNDEARIRVYGQFPERGENQLIPNASYEQNVHRDVHVSPLDAVIVGVDVARYGGDLAVIWVRRGRDAETDNDFKRQIMTRSDTFELAGRVAETCRRVNADLINVDAGYNPGVIDTLRDWGFNVNAIHFGGKPTLPGFFNMRAQMWGRMRDALREGVRLPEMQQLQKELTQLQYKVTGSDVLQLERKEDMKKRTGFSPDHADALALTFAIPYVADMRAGGFEGWDETQGREYDPFAAI